MMLPGPHDVAIYIVQYVSATCERLLFRYSRFYRNYQAVRRIRGLR